MKKRKKIKPVTNPKRLVENSEDKLPADKIIMDTWDTIRYLKISQRKLAQLRADRLIRFYIPGLKMEPKAAKKEKGKRSGKIYFTLQDVLDYVKSNPIDPI